MVVVLTVGRRGEPLGALGLRIVAGAGASDGRVRAIVDDVWGLRNAQAASEALRPMRTG